MTGADPDWITTRKRCVRLTVPVLVALSLAQMAFSAGQSPLRLALGGAYIAVCIAAIWVLLERAELVRNDAPLRWKILTWAVPALSGFAMVGHVLSGRPLEHAILGGGCALTGILSLFIAFSPDDADLIDNDQMTRPSKP